MIFFILTQWVLACNLIHFYLAYREEDKARKHCEKRILYESTFGKPSNIAVTKGACVITGKHFVVSLCVKGHITKLILVHPNPYDKLYQMIMRISWSLSN